MVSLRSRLVSDGKGLLAVLAVSVLTLLPFAPFFANSGNVLLQRDLSNSALPAKAVWLRGVLAEGRIPRWTSLQGRGAPFYAELVGAPLYPLNALFLAMGEKHLPEALTLYILLHYPLFFLGAVFLARHFRQPWSVAIAMALSATWCGNSLSLYNLSHMLPGLVSIPWFWLFWLRALERGRASDAILASFFLALPVYGGDPQYSYILALLAFAHSIWRRRLATLKAYVTVSALSLLCASAQLLPALELMRNSERAEGSASLWGIVWSLTPLRLADFIFPNFFGTSSRGMDFWGKDYSSSPFGAFFIYYLYLGFLPLLAFTWAIASGWLRRRLRRKPRAALLGLPPLFILLLCMGSWAPLPIYPLFTRFVPLWSSFRYPERLSVYFALGLILLSAPALRAQSLFSRVSRYRSWVSSLLFSGGFIAVVAGIFYALFHSRPNAGAPEIHALTMAASATLLLALVPRAFPRRACAGWIWVALILLDQARVFPGNIWFQPASVTDIEAFPATRKILDDLRKRDDEVLRGMPTRVKSLLAYQMPWEDRVNSGSILDPAGYSVLASWEGLAGNISSYFGIPSAEGYFSMELGDGARLIRTLKDSQPGLLLNLTSSRYLLERPRDEVPSVKVNHDALPIFFFPRKVAFVASPSEALATFKKAGYEASQVTLLEGSPDLSPAEHSPEVTLLERDSVHVAFKIRGGNQAPAPFVWNESYFPSWRAALDGQDVGIRRANGWAMAAAIPALDAGEHRLEFRFHEGVIRVGQALSAGWLLLLALALAWNLRGDASTRRRVEDPVS